MLFKVTLRARRSVVIASFAHQFIFLKTRKTAGTSVEIALASSCGDDDIITPIGLADELLRSRGGVVAARNFVADTNIDGAYRQSVLDRDAGLHRRITEAVREHGYYNHMPAAEVALKLPKDFWESALKFSIVRHPYERAVSAAYFRLHLRGLPLASLPDVLTMVCGEPRLDNSPIYSIGSGIIADDMIRYETLEDDLRRICAKLSVAIPDKLPRAKSAMRIDRRPAQEILTDAQKERVFQTCRQAFADFGYEP